MSSHQSLLGSRTLTTILRLAEHPVIKYRSTPDPAYLVLSVDALHEILVRDWRSFSKDTRINLNFRDSVADGLLTSDGEEWLQQRRVLQPLFKKEAALEAVPYMATEATSIVDCWVALDGALQADVRPDVSAWSMGTVLRRLLSLDVTRADIDALAHAIDRSVRDLANTGSDQLSETAEEIRDIVKLVLTSSSLSPFRDSPVKPSRHSWGPQSIEQIVTLLLAGYETTASALTWTLYLLANNPVLQMDLARRVRAVLRTRRLAVQDVPDLGFLVPCFIEAIRLYPPAWVLGRRARSPVYIADQEIPAGAVLALSPFAVQRNPANWPDPHAYDPTRPLPRRPLAAVSQGFCAFGAGPRSCVGYHWAMTEAVVFLAAVLQRCSFSLLDDRSISADAAYVLRPREGLFLNFKAA